MGIIVSSIQFDRWRAAEFRQAAERAGFALGVEFAEVGQGFRDMSPRIELFEQLMLQNKIRHGAHPLLNMSAANAIVVSDPAGNRKLDKSKATQRIDPLVAAVMAVGAFTDQGSALDVSAMIC